MNVSFKTVQKALAYSVKKHKNQKRKTTGAPYIIHPMAVLAILYEVKDSKNINLLATCAILHDVVEDCDVSLEKIADKFGFAVAAIVEELTNDKNLLLLEGKTDYLINKMTKMSSYALVIKLCDRIHNIMDRSTYDDYMVQTKRIVEHLIKERYLTATHLVLLKKINSIIYKVQQNDSSESNRSIGSEKVH